MPYIGRSLGDGVRARYIYAATSGQTTFSGNDANGIALAYSDTLYMDVYQNGVLLKPVTDYASTTGTSVVLVTGASTSDVVEMIVYDSFAVADTVSAANGGAFAGAVSVSGAFTSPGIDDNADANAITISVNEEVTMPLQPAFLGKVASQISNLSIAGASNTDIPFNTEVFDQGGNFASSVFTAPITGRYQLSLDMRLDNVDSGTTDYHFYLVTSNRTISFSFSPRFSADANFFPVVLSSLMDMDASDTAKIQYYITGGTAQTDIAVASYFSGFLAC